MKNLVLKTCLTAALVSCLMTGGVYAEENSNMPQEAVSANGAVDIFLPTANWKEIQYDGACVAFSDGDGVILFNHYAKGEPVTNVEPGAANEFFYETIQAANDVKYVFYGYADSQEDLDLIKIALANAKVDSTKLPADEKHEPAKDQYSIEANDFIGYVVASELNVRSEEGVNGEAIGCLGYGDEVHVTGNVLVNGASAGWYQIDFDGNKGYVSSEFISSNKPEPQPDPDPQPVIDSDIVDYTDVLFFENGDVLHVSYLTDGRVVDSNGNELVPFADGGFKMPDGTVVTEWNPTKQSFEDWNEHGRSTEGEKTLHRADGSEGEVFLREEGGGWVSNQGDAFTDNGDGTWTNATDGTLWN